VCGHIRARAAEFAICSADRVATGLCVATSAPETAGKRTGRERVTEKQIFMLFGSLNEERSNDEFMQEC